MSDDVVRATAAELEGLSGGTTFEEFLGRVLVLVTSRAVVLAVAAELEARVRRPHDDAAIAARRVRLAVLAGLYPAKTVTA